MSKEIRKGQIRGSKDIAEIMDYVKAELIDLYRRKRMLTSINCSVFISADGAPTMECEYTGFIEDG